MKKIAITGLLAVLAACSAAQIQQAATALASPAGQALVTELESFTPGVSGVVASINSGIAATAADKQMVCGAMSEANGLFLLAAPLVGISAADQATESAAMAGVNTACDSTTTDLQSTVTTVLAAYAATTKSLASAGVAVSTATVTP